MHSEQTGGKAPMGKLTSSVLHSSPLSWGLDLWREVEVKISYRHKRVIDYLMGVI